MYIIIISIMQAIIIYYLNLFVFIIAIICMYYCNPISIIVNYYCHHDLLFIFMYILLKHSISRWPVCSVCSSTILGAYNSVPR